MARRPDPSSRGFKPGFRAGDWAEVRSAAEILGTLDAEGSLDALPFMPEMLQYCGVRFRVYKSAHKSCDTIKTWRNRRMNAAVHLEGLRCTGDAHVGCQAGCLLYWKEAWLKPAPGPKPDGDVREVPTDALPPADGAGCNTESLRRMTRVPEWTNANPDEGHRCQATEMFRATTPVQWDPRPYVQDLRSRNVRPSDFLRYGILALLSRLRRFPHIRGRAGATTPPGEPLDLQPGEWVQVRSRDEILRTLNRKLKHRGLFFDVEMLPFCGRTFRVLRRVDRLIDDRSGKMVFPRSACLILENVMCGGCLSRDRMFCPRSIYPYWHEAWLKRVGKGAGASAARTSD